VDDGGKLQDRINRLRTLPGLVDRVVPGAARAVDQEIRKQIKSGVGPDGKPWKLTEDGRVPLRNAGAALTTATNGKVVVASLEGVESRHHLGAVRGGVKRQILPTQGKLPEPMSKAIAEVCDREFERTMRR
jgi:hypothetical protein